MKQNEFNALLRQNSDKKSGHLDVAKIALLPNAVRNQMINYIVRKRMAIVTAFINDETDVSWLHSMGYLYNHKNKAGFEFLCTCENIPVDKWATYAKLIEYAYPSSTTATKAGMGSTGCWFVALYKSITSCDRVKILEHFKEKQAALDYANAMPNQFHSMHKYFD